MNNIEKFLEWQRTKNMKFGVVIQSISDLDKKDVFLIELNKIIANFNNKNTSGKSFLGYEELKDKLNTIKGSKKLIDNANDKIYTKWYVDGIPHSMVFIGIDEKENEIKVEFEDAIIID